MGMYSSWNPDRVAAAILAGKPATSRRFYKRPGVKVMKASTLYIREYGEKAYNAWRRRESEIDTLMFSGKYRKYEIVQLREDNLRRMKAEGRTFAQQVIGSGRSTSRLYAPAA